MPQSQLELLHHLEDQRGLWLTLVHTVLRTLISAGRPQSPAFSLTSLSLVNVRLQMSGKEVLVLGAGARLFEAGQSIAHLTEACRSPSSSDVVNWSEEVSHFVESTGI